MTLIGAAEAGGTKAGWVGGEKRWLDRPLIWILAGLGVIAALFLLFVPHFYLPAEDAIILFQFSRNLAHTGAITYIPYGPHAEGATDFAWMLLISGAIKLGLDPYWMVAVVNFLGILLFAFALIRMAAARVSAIAVLFVVGVFGLLPQLWSAAAGFSTIPFACLLLLLIHAILEGQELAPPLLSLLLCLFRPDGVVFALPLLTAGIVSFPGKRRKFGFDLALFVAPGVAYFLWRWHYFGELLPLPFMVKSDAVRLGHYLVVDSLKEAAEPLLFSFVVLLIVLRGRMKDWKNLIVLICVIVLPTLFYLGMRLDQDVGRRFFIYLPVAVAVLVARNWTGLGTRQALTLRVAAAAWVLFLFAISFKLAHGSRAFQFTNRLEISEGLGKLPHGTLLATEAGIAPYYSGWATYDSWGLSTAEFARHLLQPEDVVQLNPDLVLIHTGNPPTCEKSPNWHVPHSVRTWDNMVQNLVEGTDTAHYELWYAPRSNAGTIDRVANVSDMDWDCWYVRKDSPLGSGVENVLALNHGITRAQYELALAKEASSDPRSRKRGESSLVYRIKTIWHKIAS